MTEVPKLPKALEAIADKVLAYKPKNKKAKLAKKRRQTAATAKRKLKS